MKIKPLISCSFDEIFDCFQKSFSNYIVPLNFDATAWEKRFQAAGVDYSLSFGIFDNTKLVAFIINCVGFRQGQLVAYNTGTGVLPFYRGNHLVDKLYEYAKPVLKQRGISKSLLEVITDNEIALHTYERIGFKKTRFYRCYKGELKVDKEWNLKTQEASKGEIDDIQKQFDHFYSWDNCTETINNAYGQYKTIKVSDQSGLDIGFFIINPDTGYLAQFEVFSQSEDSWQKLFSSVATISKTISIKNVDVKRTNLIDILNKVGFNNYINQYEMEML